MADSDGLPGASPLASTKAAFEISLPVVIGCDESAGRVIHPENRIREQPGKPKATERWPQRAKHYRLGFGPGDDKATDQNVVTGPNEPPCREVERLRPHCRELCTFQMNRNGVVCSVTARWLGIDNRKSFRRRRSGPGVERMWDGRHSTINNRVIN